MFSRKEILVCAESLVISVKRSGIDIVLDGLEALEYRGYDSAGIAMIDGEQEPGLQTSWSG